MKRTNLISWLCAALAGTLLFSCTPKEIEAPVSINKAYPEHVRADIEQPSDAGTKTWLEQSNYWVQWSDGDEFSMAAMSTQYGQYRYSAEQGMSNFIELVDVPSPEDIDHVVALYPFSSTVKYYADGSVDAILPGEQTYVPDSFAPNAALMMAAAALEDSKITFRNTCGILVIKLYGEDVNVQNIRLSALDADARISGTFNISMEVRGIPQMEFLSSGANYIDMVCTEPVALNAGEADYTEFYFMVPPGTYHSMGILVTTSGGGSFEKTTSKDITITRNHITRMAPVEVIPEGGIQVPEAIDLGLPSGTLWASFNLGASAPEEDGNYYAFAETETKDDYSYSYWKYLDKSYGFVLKYNLWEEYGPIDRRIGLDPEDDAAHVLLGSDWRIPTLEELDELRTKCTITTETVNGVSVRKFTGPNNNYIYIPNAGYRTGTRYVYKESNPRPILGSRCVTKLSDEYTDHMTFGTMMPTGLMSLSYSCGVSIRPVKRALVLPESLTVNAPASLMIEQKTTATVTFSPENVTDTRVSWTSSNPAVASVNAETGEITALSQGGTVIRAYSSDGQLTNSTRLNVLEYDEPASVDLGLPSGTLWASCNLGAPNSTNGEYETGVYFAWGELNPKDNYAWSNYRYGRGNLSLSKYDGLDGLLELEVTKDDAARYHLGGTWRIPTQAEWEELISNCNFATVQSPSGGKQALKFTSKKNGEYIILPMGGYMDGTSVSNSTFVFGQSSSVSTGDFSYFMCFRGARGAVPNVFETERYAGYPIRPVKNVYVPVTSISILPAGSLTMNAGDVTQLSLEVTPSNASYKTATWESSDTSVATIDADGWVSAMAPGQVTITAISTDNSSIKATKTITVKMEEPEAIDLDLPSGLKWAEFNLGASHKTAPGSYYAWGDTKPSSIYGWDYYLWGTSSNITKYNTTDNLVTLLPEDDAATEALGNGWRMPTQKEFKELIDECTWTLVSLHDGISSYYGALITGRNGNQIFIPAAGFIMYNGDSAPTYPGDIMFVWTSTRHPSNPLGAVCVMYYDDGNGMEPEITAYTRFNGGSIRPVKD